MPYRLKPEVATRTPVTRRHVLTPAEQTRGANARTLHRPLPLTDAQRAVSDQALAVLGGKVKLCRRLSRLPFAEAAAVIAEFAAMGVVRS